MKIFVSGGAKNGKSAYAQRIVKQIATRNAKRPGEQIGNRIEEQSGNQSGNRIGSRIEKQIDSKFENRIDKRFDNRFCRKFDFDSEKSQSADVPLYYVATMKSADPEDDARIARHRAERDGWGFVTIEQPVDIEEILGRCDHCGTFLLDSLTALLANEMFPPPDWNLNERAADKIAEGLSQVLKAVSDIVVVSDFIYSDAVLYDPFTEKYRKFLAQIDRTAAEGCDVVLEAAYANIIVHKGKEKYERFFETLA